MCRFALHWNAVVAIQFQSRVKFSPHTLARFEVVVAEVETQAFPRY